MWLKCALSPLIQRSFTKSIVRASSVQELQPFPTVRSSKFIIWLTSSFMDRWGSLLSYFIKMKQIKYLKSVQNVNSIAFHFKYSPKRCECKWGRPSLGWKTKIISSERSRKNLKTEDCTDQLGTPKGLEDPRRQLQYMITKLYWISALNAVGILVKVYNQEMSS